MAQKKGSTRSGFLSLVNEKKVTYITAAEFALYKTIDHQTGTWVGHMDTSFASGGWEFERTRLPWGCPGEMLKLLIDRRILKRIHDAILTQLFIFHFQ